MRKPKNYTDVEYREYYMPRKSKKIRSKKITGSTKATSDFLSVVHEENPSLTVLQLKQLLTDRRKYIFSPEAIAVLDAYIKAGYGDHVPNWRYY